MRVTMWIRSKNLARFLIAGALALGLGFPAQTQAQRPCDLSQVASWFYGFPDLPRAVRWTKIALPPQGTNDPRAIEIPPDLQHELGIIRIVREGILGRGAFGTVYKVAVITPTGSRTMALKELRRPVQEVGEIPARRDLPTVHQSLREGELAKPSLADDGPDSIYSSDITWIKTESIKSDAQTVSITKQPKAKNALSDSDDREDAGEREAVGAALQNLAGRGRDGAVARHLPIAYHHFWIQPAKGRGFDTFLMDYIEGTSMKDLMFKVRAFTLYASDGSLIQDRAQVEQRTAAAWDFLQQATFVAEGAHEKGVLHLDLKPGNIIRKPDGTYVFLDWGLARPINQPNDGRIRGTFGYIPLDTVNIDLEKPLNIQAPHTRANDNYAIAVMICEALLGKSNYFNSKNLSWNRNKFVWHESFAREELEKGFAAMRQNALDIGASGAATRIDWLEKFVMHNLNFIKKETIGPLRKKLKPKNKE